MAKDRYVELIEACADVILAAVPVPLRILDVGCGTGDLLRELAVRVPYCQAYVGVDEVAANVARARVGTDPRLRFLCALPSSLPFPDGSFDLVVADDTANGADEQLRAVGELARVVSPAGTVVIIDRSAALRGDDDRARSTKLLPQLLDASGLRLQRREPVARMGRTRPMVQAFIAIP